MTSTTARPRIERSDPEGGEQLTTAQFHVNRTALTFAPQSDAPAG